MATADLFPKIMDRQHVRSRGSEPEPNPSQNRSSHNSRVAKDPLSSSVFAAATGPNQAPMSPTTRRDLGAVGGGLTMRPDGHVAILATREPGKDVG